jgi:hypothetical protein
MVAMTGGVATVNYYYGYYTTRGQMWADFHGGTGNLGVITAASSTTALGSGRLGWTDLPGMFAAAKRPGPAVLPCGKLPLGEGGSHRLSDSRFLRYAEARRSYRRESPATLMP